ncbi:hypothetical protein [Alkalihalophilus pseudofirmus]|uniref:Uncharacterized protein BpOF4_21044 n=1 Tax=Alkalihalophilus pseudofirmus (strain ATCC BAA-2126 / JCM 17055 / OF4) TaxID=398511 RepID=Y4208_ALKPO|nr:hypothetical protein [Alkalihalophilus pseudofirmus]Q45130.1 RecName: Full=Uncharacterized protein BpOF4_21044; AltName: Full=ORFB [Alkalihalophilus pseudofirmus OF4]AAB05370.1 unknown [Cytobacillus firmus]
MNEIFKELEGDCMGENVQLKDVIFNDSKYSKTKKVLAIMFITFVFLLQVNGTDKMIGFIFVFTGTVIGVTYSVCKLLFYNTKRYIKDIVFLIIFVCLFVWGIITFFNL